MARRKRTSAVLDTARKRLAGLKSIEPLPSFGGELDIPHYEQYIENFSTQLDKYHEMLSALDQYLNGLEAAEANLNSMNKRMLAATGARYGTDSNEYEAAGGTRDSERKAPARTPTANA